MLNDVQEFANTSIRELQIKQLLLVLQLKNLDMKQVKTTLFVTRKVSKKR